MNKKRIHAVHSLLAYLFCSILTTGIFVEYVPQKVRLVVLKKNFWPIIPSSD